MKSKRIISVLLVISLLSVFFVLPANAAEKSGASSYGTDGGVTINSTLPIQGPTNGAIEAGTVYRSIYKNWGTLSAVTAALATMLGCPQAAVASSVSSYLITALSEIGVGEVYYTRTEYYTDDTRMEYYYEYNYYSNPDYTGYLGTAYSYIYSNWY